MKNVKERLNELQRVTEEQHDYKGCKSFRSGFLITNELLDVIEKNEMFPVLFSKMVPSGKSDYVSYKLEVDKANKRYSLILTDIVTGKVLSKREFFLGNSDFRNFEIWILPLEKRDGIVKILSLPLFQIGEN